MITARELASECNVPVSEVMTALADMRELTLGPDSGVRDEAADAVRTRIRHRQHSESTSDNPPTLASDEQLRALREKLSGVAGGTPAPTINLTAPAARNPRNKARGWRPGDDPLHPVVKALADQIVVFSQVRNRPVGVIFSEELADARQRQTAWARVCIEQGVLLSDEAIVAWIRAFPHRILQPDKIVPLAAHGLTASDARLRLWYGRINEGRLPLLDQLGRGDITIEKAVADVANFKGQQAN